MKKFLRYSLAIILTAFGLLTLFMTSSVILDLFGIRAKEGNYVLFVVWTNFFCGLIYVIAAVGCIKRKIWTTRILSLSAILVSLSFLGLIIYIWRGGIYETETIRAMTFRLVLTLLFILTSYFTINKNLPSKNKTTC